MSWPTSVGPAKTRSYPQGHLALGTRREARVYGVLQRQPTWSVLITDRGYCLLAVRQGAVSCAGRSVGRSGVGRSGFPAARPRVVDSSFKGGLGALRPERPGEQVVPDREFPAAELFSLSIGALAVIPAARPRPAGQSGGQTPGSRPTLPWRMVEGARREGACAHASKMMCKFR